MANGWVLPITQDIDIPGRDHGSLWEDPISKRFLLLDQPYLGGADKPHPREAERQSWCERYGYLQLRSSWGGTYLPPESTLIMFTKADKGLDLQAIETALAKLPDDFNAESWQGQSHTLIG